MSGNIFYASDKALYDAINQHKFTNGDIKELFYNRGIIISKDSEREKVAKYFSSLNHDYFDHQKIAQIFSSETRKEKICSTKINNQIPDQTIEEILNAVKDDEVATGGFAEINVYQRRVDLKIRYEEFDFNKSEFRQLREKEAIISLERNGHDWIIRRPLNGHVDTVVQKIIDKMAKKIGNDKLSIKDIDLSLISDPSLRTKFFTDLIDSISDFELFDVTDVYVFHPILKGQEDEEILTHIRKASLNGQGVLQSSEFKGLLDKGFYIWKLKWKAGESKSGSDLYDFEAQFGDQENCRMFSYLVKGIYKFNEETGLHNQTRKPISELDEVRLFRLIEATAESVANKIVKT